MPLPFTSVHLLTTMSEREKNIFLRYHTFTPDLLIICISIYILIFFLSIRGSAAIASPTTFSPFFSRRQRFIPPRQVQPLRSFRSLFPLYLRGNKTGKGLLLFLFLFCAERARKSLKNVDVKIMVRFSPILLLPLPPF